ncbi:hypothetical protein JL720_8258 [Aureococcus anophagefferens]|nr:hypothetical protein JL720_8258 [Aureococcus anophagefferens]
MLANINGALRGVYVVESIDLEFLRCRVRGYRPAGGGLPPFLRSAAKQLAGRDKKRRDVGFCLKARLAGAPRVGLLFASSRTSPWPRTTRVELERPPKIELDRDALSIVDDAADSEHSLRFLKLLYGFVPKEVLVGMLERKRDPSALASPSAAKNAQPSLASIRKKAETLGRDLPKQRRRLFEAAREIAAAAAVSSSPKALPMPRVGFKGDDEEEDDDDDDDDDELDLDDEDDEEELDEASSTRRATRRGDDQGQGLAHGRGMSEVTMYLTSIKSDTHGDPDFNLLEEPVAAIVATPSIVKNEQRTIYMTGSLKFLVNGSNFRAKSTAFTFDPPLYRDVDYVMTVKSPETAQLTLKTGRKRIWRAGVTVEATSDKKYYQSAPELTILGHGFNESSSLNVLRWGNKLMGKGVNYTIVAGTKNTLTLSLAWGSKWRPNAANLPGPLTFGAPGPLTTIYRTLTHELWVTGSGFVRGSTSLDLVSTAPKDGELALKPFVDYVLVVFNQTHLRVSLRDGKAWANGPDGELKCVGLDTGPGKIPSVDGDARVLATIAADAMHKSGAAVTRTAMTQTIYETPALKKLTITGEHLCADGYRGTDAKVTFSPPVADDVFTVNQAAEKKVVLDLRKSPLARGDPAHPELVLYGAHSRRVVVRGSGFSPEGTELTLEPTPRKSYHVVEVTETTVLLELEPDAAWVAPEVLAKDAAKGVDLKVSKVYYGGFYDDYYGAYFDDFADLPACPYGTDCTDCQPLHGDSHYTEVKDAECDNTCEFSRDGFCDDTRTNGYCKLGTDCQDCGPASAGNYSTYDDDAWWDDDASNWYWDDDYYDDDRRRFDDFYYDTATFSGNKDGVFDDDAVGYVRSTPNPFDPDDDLGKPADGGAASLLVAALLVTALGLAACAAARVARGGKVCAGGRKDGDSKESLAASWQEMTSNPSAKKTNIPITPDVAYTGDHPGSRAPVKNGPSGRFQGAAKAGRGGGGARLAQHVELRRS